MREACRPAASGDGDRRARVPLVLAAGVGVDVGLAADDGHGLGAGRAHLDQLAVELLGERRSPRPAGGCG